MYEIIALLPPSLLSRATLVLTSSVFERVPHGGGNLHKTCGIHIFDFGARRQDEIVTFGQKPQARDFKISITSCGAAKTTSSMALVLETSSKFLRTKDRHFALSPRA